MTNDTTVKQAIIFSHVDELCIWHSIKEVKVENTIQTLKYQFNRSQEVKSTIG